MRSAVRWLFVVAAGLPLANLLWWPASDEVTPLAVEAAHPASAERSSSGAGDLESEAPAAVICRRYGSCGRCAAVAGCDPESGRPAMACRAGRCEECRRDPECSPALVEYFGPHVSREGSR